MSNAYPWTNEMRREADALNAKVEQEAAREAELDEPLFMGIAERWYDRHLCRCANGHVNGMFKKSEQYGMDLCLTCNAPVRMTFPEDKGLVS